MNNSLKCDKCNKTFSEERYLKQHISRRIPCDAVHKCIKCNKIFKSAQHLRNHKNRKNPCMPDTIPIIDLKQDENKCKYCGNDYYSKYTLKRHIKSCPMKNNQSYLIGLVEKLTEKIDRLEQNRNIQPVQQTVNNVQNIQNNMYVNVTICSFGSEDLSKLDTNAVIRLIKNNSDNFGCAHL